MLRIVKHIATVALCLLVIGGAVGTRIYVFICSHDCCGVQLSLTDSRQGCCCNSRDDDENSCSHDESASVLNDADLCGTTISQALSVSSFEVAQICSLNKVAPLAALFSAVPHTCGVACSCAATFVCFSPVSSPHSPDIYAFGQLRL